LGTDFDDFSDADHIDAINSSPEQARNALRLRETMKRHGFQDYKTEWWHFDWHNWKNMPPL
jgi:D-alanyl-D-alanine dipeptidase